MQLPIRLLNGPNCYKKGDIVVLTEPFTTGGSEPRRFLVGHRGVVDFTEHSFVTLTMDSPPGGLIRVNKQSVRKKNTTD